MTLEEFLVLVEEVPDDAVFHVIDSDNVWTDDVTVEVTNEVVTIKCDRG